MMPKLKTPISYYGGKQNMLKHLLPLIPEHKTYIEPFFWWWALFRAKEPVDCEVINDVNMNVINFYAVLKSQYEVLHKLVEQTLHSRETYKKALIIYESPRLFADSPVTRAWAFYVVTNQWFACKVGSRGYDREKKTAHTIQNKIDNFKDTMTERLRYTQIEQNEAYKVIQSRDGVDAFIYADPPYINTNCGHYWGYLEEHFIRDLEVLATIKGKFLLSNFPSDILTEYVKKYNRYTKTIDKPLTAGNRYKSGQGKRKQEVLVANYPI
jgi:DNA adenine methylase